MLQHAARHHRGQGRWPRTQRRLGSSGRTESGDRSRPSATSEFGWEQALWLTTRIRRQGKSRRRRYGIAQPHLFRRAACRSAESHRKAEAILYPEATRGGAEAVGLEHVGYFGIGMQFDALRVDCAGGGAGAGGSGALCVFPWDTLRDRVQKFLHLVDDRHIVGTFVLRVGPDGAAERRRRLSRCSRHVGPWLRGSQFRACGRGRKCCAAIRR
jgi:hypothetical protein